MLGEFFFQEIKVCWELCRFHWFFSLSYGPLKSLLIWLTKKMFLLKCKTDLNHLFISWRMPGRSSAVNIVVFSQQDSGLGRCHSMTCLNEIKLSHKFRNREALGARKEVLGRQWGKLTWFQLLGLSSLQMQLKLIFAERNKKDEYDDAWHLRRASDILALYQMIQF